MIHNELILIGVIKMSTDGADLPVMMTTAEVAEFIRASKASLDQDRYLQRGLPYVKIGRRIRYRREDVLKYLDANTSQRVNHQNDGASS